MSTKKTASKTEAPKQIRRQRTAEERMADLETQMRATRLRAVTETIEDPEVVAVARCLSRVYSAQGATASPEAGKTLSSAAKPLETYLTGLGIEL